MMRVLTGIVVIAAVHATTSFLVMLLPDAATIALGILGGNRTSVDNYWKARETASYSQQIAQLLRGDFGMTLDNTRVSSEMLSALSQTAPSFAAGICIAVVLSGLALRAKPATRAWIGSVAGSASLLPPFIFPFLVAPVLFLSSYASSPIAARVALIASIAVPLVVMITVMLLRFYDEALNEYFGGKLTLNGLPLDTVHRLSRLSAGFRIVDLFDRIAVTAIVSILLAEPLLGVSGLGTLAARAIKTADPNLTIAITTVIAVVVVGFGVASAWLRPAFEALFLSR